MAKRNPVISTAAKTIKAAGFDAMARQFVREPELRERIIKAVSADVSRNISPEMGARMQRTLTLALSLA